MVYLKFNLDCPLLIITFAVKCDPSQDSWDYSPHSGLLKHEQSGKCLKVTRTPLKLWLKDCNSRDTEQKWFWSNFDDEGLFLGESEDTEAEADLSTPRTDL